jgi:hypothetical protein
VLGDRFQYLGSRAASFGLRQDAADPQAGHLVCISLQVLSKKGT